VLAIIIIGLPVLISIYGGLGARIGEYLAASFQTGNPEDFASAIRRWLALYCLILIFVSPPQTVQSHLVEKQLRDLRALQQLPFHDFQLYCIRMLKEISAIYLFLFPLTLIPSMKMSAAEVPLPINLVLFLSPFLFLFWIMVLSRLVMTIALLASPQNILGWRVVFGGVIILVAAIARPLGNWLAEGDLLSSSTLLPLSDWVGTLAQAYLEQDAQAVLLRVSLAAGFTVLLFVIDVGVFRFLLLRRSDYLLARAMKSGKVNRLEQGLLNALDVLPDSICAMPFRPVLKKQLIWMIRDPVLGFAFLIPLLTMALAFGVVELMLPVGIFVIQPTFALGGTMLVGAILLVLGGIILPAISLPASGRNIANFLEAPWPVSKLLLAQIASSAIPTSVMWGMAWAITVFFFPTPGLSLNSAAHTAIPVLLVLAAFYCSACGVPLGCICKKNQPRNPFLSIHLAGLAAQISLGFLALISIPGSLMLPFTLGPKFWPFPLAVLLIWSLWARFLFIQGKRNLVRTLVRT
jgi:hypothetical protein